MTLLQKMKRTTTMTTGARGHGRGRSPAGRRSPSPALASAALVGALTLALTMLLPACATSPSSHGPYAPLVEADRNSDLARRLTQQAVKLMDSDPEEAERLLREALTADLYHGPAHNNLGVIFLNRGELFSAAGEFEWARKLLPGLPDPRMNLALTLERAGRIDEAIGAYRAALEVYPGHIPSMQALASVQLRHGRADRETAGMLEEIALRGEDTTWREWALAQGVRLSP